jgi:hypothetical protein
MVLGSPLVCAHTERYCHVRPWSELLNTSIFCAVKLPVSQAVPDARMSPWLSPGALRGTSYSTGPSRSQPGVFEVIVEIGLADQVTPPSVLR